MNQLHIVPIVAFALALAVSTAGCSTDAPPPPTPRPLPPPVPKVANIVVRELPTYVKGLKHGPETWHNVQIRKGTTRADLIAWAKAYHHNHPKQRCWIYDDNRLFEKLMLLEMRDPFGSTPELEKWVGAHDVGMITWYAILIDDPGWYLAGQYAGPLKLGELILLERTNGAT